MEKHSVQSVDRAFRLLECLALNHPHGAILKDLSYETKLNKTTAFRILSVLVENGYIEKNEASVYKLTHKMLEIGKRAIPDRDLISISRIYLEKLSVLCNETVLLSVPQGNGVMTAFAVDLGDNQIKVVQKIGHIYPLYSTGSGKAILATLNPHKLNETWNTISPEKITKNTITDLDILKDELVKIRLNGYAVEDEENNEGIVSVSAIIVDKSKKVVGTVDVSAPKIRMDEKRLETIAKNVMNTAKSISRSLE